MKIVNLTPHELNIHAGGKVITIPASGTIARVGEIREETGNISLDGVDIPVFFKKFGEVEGLPAPLENTFYVVSALVAQAAPHRDDVLIVDQLVRDDAGRIVGASAFARV